MTFYAVELEGVCPAYGWQGGPSGDTRVKTLRNRHERRNANASLARHQFNLPFQNIPSDDYARYLKSMHMAMYAMTHSFLVKDWLDFKGIGQSLGVAPSGSAAVQLQRVYSVYAGTTLIATRTRPITKPVAGTITVYQADGSGNPVAKAGATDQLTGLFTPSTAWTAGRALTADFEFRVPVRFNNDWLPFSIDTRSAGQHVVNGSVELWEVFGE